MRRFAILFVFCAACGSDPEPFTWGDMSQGLSEAFCGAAVKCGYYVEGSSAVDQCVRHAVHHLCELPDTCGVELDAKAEEALGICVDALAMPYENDCFNLYYFGVVPDACAPVFEYTPEGN